MSERRPNPDERTVLASAFRRLRRAASSPWAQNGDALVAVVDATGHVVSSDGPARHAVAATELVAGLQERRGVELEDGDLVVHNDPYTGGTSLIDLAVVSASGTGPERRYGVARMRVLDVGGGEPGGVFPAARQVIQEGDRVPPVRIAEDGHLLPDLVRRLAINTRSRGAYMRDLVALADASQVAAGSVRRTEVEPERTTTVPPAGEGAASVVVRGTLLRSPRTLRVRATARNGRYAIDFSETDAADEGPGNIPWSATVASGLEALRAATGAAEPITTLARRVTWAAPEGCLVRPSYPAACSAGALYARFAVREAVARALAAMGLPRIEWPTWAGGGVLSGPPTAEYAILLPLDCPGSLDELRRLVPGARVEVTAEGRWGRHVMVDGPRDAGLRITTWLVEIDREGPQLPGPAVTRASPPATVWLSDPSWMR